MRWLIFSDLWGWLNYTAESLWIVPGSNVEYSEWDMIFRYRNFIYDGADNREYAYDSNGNVTRDDNRGISSIEYNALGLPSRISVGSGSSIEYIYSADGIKLGSRYTEGRAASYALQAEQTEQSAQPYAYISEDYDYIGCYEFRNRNLFRVNTPYGYYLAGEFTPYMRDYQGNNRNEAGYYAYGLPASDSDVKSYDPYLYGDKMLYTLKGLNIYDFLARTYAPDIARFMQPDPLATENHGVSPYIYCLSDPINFIDPTGEKVYYVDMTGRLISSEEAGTGWLFETQLKYGYTIREVNHSHPTGKTAGDSDITFRNSIISTMSKYSSPI